MSTITRQHAILKWVSRHGERSVQDLVEEMGVSPMTIRRDLATLAESGRVIRTHGGAAPASQVMFEFQFLRRTREHRAAKARIGRLAAARVQPGSTVMLDSGTTTMAVAQALRGLEGITVITTSLPVAAELQYAPNIDIVLLGGRLRRDAPDLGGALTLQNLDFLHADVAFLGADGIDRNGTVYNDAIDVGTMLIKMAAAATTVYCVADHSKFGRCGLMRFGNLAQWAGLITDRPLPHFFTGHDATSQIRILT